MPKGPPSELPIILDDAQVRAAWEGRMTELRLPIAGDRCPYRAGMLLWVKQAYAARADVDPATEREKARHYAHYRAYYEGSLRDEWHCYAGWRPARAMPRWACSLELEVTSVRRGKSRDDGSPCWVVRFRRLAPES